MEMKVNLEKYPTRCEVCHQSDLFDPLTNCCQRCKNINKSLLVRRVSISRGRIILSKGTLLRSMAMGAVSTPAIIYLLLGIYDYQNLSENFFIYSFFILFYGICFGIGFGILTRHFYEWAKIKFNRQ
jgi:hypothetical protein